MIHTSQPFFTIFKGRDINLSTAFTLESFRSNAFIFRAIETAEDSTIVLYGDNSSYVHLKMSDVLADKSTTLVDGDDTDAISIISVRLREPGASATYFIVYGVEDLNKIIEAISSSTSGTKIKMVLENSYYTTNQELVEPFGSTKRETIIDGRFLTFAMNALIDDENYAPQDNMLVLSRMRRTPDAKPQLSLVQ